MAARCAVHTCPEHTVSAVFWWRLGVMIAGHLHKAGPSFREYPLSSASSAWIHRGMPTPWSYRLAVM